VSKANGFLQLRRGLWEHLRDGRMSITQALAFIYICSEADTRTGIWKGCAKSLSGELGIPERTARDVLEKMEHGNYVRRFAVPGRHSCYPILVHKFLITDSEHSGEQLDALNSIDANTLRYLPVETSEQGVECGVQHSVEHSAAQKRKRIEKETEKKPAAKTAPPPDPRHKPFFDFAYKLSEMKFFQSPTWGGRHAKVLQNFLREHQHITQEEWERRYRAFLQSTVRFYREQHGDLEFFIRNFDKFMSGPVLAAVQKGDEYGKHTAGSSFETTLSSHVGAEGFTD
jgi:hypothetical protein